MAGATLTTLSSILKNFYLPPVIEQLNNEVLLLQRLESRDQELFGTTAVVPLHKGRSGGIGARAEGGQLPSPGNQSYAAANYSLKYLYGRVRVTGPSMAQTASDAGAFLQSLKSELDGVRADLRKDTARQVWGDGTAQISGVTSNVAGVITLDDAEAITKSQLYVGMVVDVGTAANPTLKTSAATITAVTPATPSITVDNALISTASTDFIYRAGSAAASSVVHEIDHGFQKLIANSPTTGTVGNINRATAGNEYWRNLSTNLAGALTLDSLMQSFNRVRIAGGEVSAMYTSFGVQRAYYNLLQSQVRYTQPTTLQGGFQVLEFMGLPFIADLEAPWGAVRFCDEKYFKVFSNQDWHFLDEDGDILKWRPDYDEWEAVLARYMNLGTTRPNTSLSLYAITDTTGY